MKILMMIVILITPMLVGATTDTLIRHDSVKVFIDRLIIENPQAIQRLTEPYLPTRKICGWTMVVTGICTGALSIIGLTEGGRSFYGNYKRMFKDSQYYQINICFWWG